MSHAEQTRRVDSGRENHRRPVRSGPGAHTLASGTRGLDWNGRMALKPDYGLRLKKDGRDSSVNLCFPGFAVYNLAVLSRDRYSTCVDIPYAGQFHAMSLDFGPDHLEAILSRGSPRLRMFVKSQLVQDPSTPRDIDLPEVVHCCVCARLGEEQQGRYESFIPLTVQSISDSGFRGA